MTEQLEFEFGVDHRSEFRKYCDEKWWEYVDEVEQWEGKQVTGKPEDYFRKYKWWLKNKFKTENRL